MTFLPYPEPDDTARASFDDELAELGFVMNGTRLWAFHPGLKDGLFALLGSLAREHDLDFRTRAILVTATASSLGDSYCSVAWGTKLARQTSAEHAAAALTGDEALLSPAESALATWARKVVREPNATTAEDLEPLRQCGWTDRQIFGLTTFVALRIAFSTVNDALGVRPDAEYHDLAPAAVLDALPAGRPLESPRPAGLPLESPRL
jgi:alkylhydroperoxidase family enzyme